MKFLLFILFFSSLFSQPHSGFDASGQNTAIHPGDDFYAHANGGWVDKTVIPADKSSYSLRLASTDLIESRLRELMERADGKIGAFYKSYMDEKKIEELGIKPLAQDMEAIKQAKTHEELWTLTGRLEFVRPILALDIQADSMQPEKYAVFVHQAGLGLPDRDYYLSDKFQEVKAKYEGYVGTCLRSAGLSEEWAKEIVQFETELAEASWTKAEARDPVASYNPMTRDELKAFLPEVAWDRLLESSSLGAVQRVVVAQKTAVQKLAKIFAKTQLEVLQAWMVFTSVDNAAPYLSKELVKAHFEMRKKALSGQEEMEMRWKSAVREVGHIDRLGWSVGDLYVAKYFPESAKKEIEALVENLKAAFEARIQHLDWLSEETKRAAIQKLAHYQVNVGYPVKSPDDSGVVVLDDDLVGNVKRLSLARWLFHVNRLESPVDRNDWVMTPHTNNAYHHPRLTKIVFPAGILQSPMFDPAADPAVNYGAIGAVIGHEMTHGFDDQGRKYDEKGALRDWWTPGDQASFETRAQVLGDQFSKYEPLPGLFINPKLTMGENIADLGGLILALDAYHASLKGSEALI